ncbi:MAG: CRTAC1 family protein, partial [Planctomycetota bacterium]|nr:CRTAC1 family protein [Planctomycetota bacterium]
ISKAMTGFGIGLPDLDNDGDKDMVTANGRVTRRNRLPGEDFWGDYAERNQIAINEGGGRFTEYLSATDPFLTPVSVSRGLAILDFDNNGKQDCLVTTAANEPRLYRNIFERSGNWIGFQLIDPALGGRNMLGAIIEITTEEQETYRGTVQSDGSYQSANDSRVHFGLGRQIRILKTIVYWPGSSPEEFQIDAVNQYYRLEKGQGKNSLAK